MAHFPRVYDSLSPTYLYNANLVDDPSDLSDNSHLTSYDDLSGSCDSSDLSENAFLTVRDTRDLTHSPCRTSPDLSLSPHFVHHDRSYNLEEADDFIDDSECSESPASSPIRMEIISEEFDNEDGIESCSDRSSGEVFEEVEDEEEEVEERQIEDENFQEEKDHNSNWSSSEDEEEEEERQPRLSTPEWNEHDQWRWECQEKMEFTVKMFERGMESVRAVERKQQERLFIVTESDVEFTVIAPFGANPIHATITFPTNDEMMGLLARVLPNSQYWLAKISTRSGFLHIARCFRFKGTDLRRQILVDRAYNRAISKPEMEKIRDCVALSPASALRLSETKKQWRTRRRMERITATESEGATPTGRKLKRRSLRLFGEKEENETVKTRRIDFDD